MNFRIISTIIGREYMTRVQKKSFLVTTFVVPILMAALCIVPIVMMMNSKEKTKHIAVTDASGIVMPYLEDTETINYMDFCDYPADSLKAHMSEFALDAVLSISPLDEVNKTVTADITFSKPLGMEMCSNISRRINDAVENYRIDSYGIEGLAEILDNVKPNISLNTYTMDEEGRETVSETGVYAALSMAMGLVIFLFITLFGGMVMSAVIEEKSSRVVEVLISSVKATELMAGKIVGIALVALTQFLLWIVLTVALVGGATALMGSELTSKLDPSAIEQVASTEMAGSIPELGVHPDLDASSTGEVGVILSTLSTLPLGKYLLVFLVFFLFGYILYACLYAAIGSAVENEGDSQQLQLPVTIPLMLGYFIAIYTFNAPDSSIAFWGSMIPFTSPIVMLARLPFGVATWELVLSAVILVLTCAFGAWVSAKVYKVGILMFGKKSSWKDLWNWIKQK